MNLDRFNLNLLVALDTVLHSRSLTDAAEKMYLTQPAMSMALKKLREHFNDELVIYSGGQQQFTPLALSLKPRVRDVLVAARDTIKVRKTFDPSTADDTFRIVTSDLTELTFLATFIAELHRTAPHVRVSAVPFDFSPVERFFLEGADLVLVPKAFSSEKYGSLHITDEDFVGLASKNNPDLSDGFDREKLLALPYAALRIPMPATNHPMGEAMLALFDKVTVNVYTNTLSSLPLLVLDSRLVAIVPLRFARQCLATMPVQIFPLPVQLPPSSIVAQWQPFRTHEPAMAWLLDLLRGYADRLADTNRDQAAGPLTSAR
jgi:LysR family nod box-dependent transcriptional activator